MLKSSFDEHGAVLAKDLLDSHTCDHITKYLFSAIEHGAAYSDSQVPTAKSLSSDSFLNLINLMVRERLEILIGRKIKSTYTYARVYKKGDELKPHTDREACELSATITVGFSHNPWPIYMADECGSDESEMDVMFHNDKENTHSIKNIVPVVMGVGDAVVYKGCEKVHWRNPLVESVWHAQVFVHYIEEGGVYDA